MNPKLPKAMAKKARANFRDEVFRRAKYRCQGPGCRVVASAGSADAILDAHHIVDRHDMPNDGYVVENGIALCKGGCHDKAEEYHRTGTPLPNFAPDDLFRIIGSSKEKAMAASFALGSG